jgi:predicted MPP superfamily phosphohydrolase
MPTSEKIAALIFVTIVLAVYSSEILLISILAYRRLKRREKAPILRPGYLLALHLIAILGLLCFLYALFIEPCRIEVNTINMQTAKLSRTGLRIVQISDLHCGRNSRNEKRIVEIINHLKPDIIAFTGDAIKLNTPGALPLFKNTMKSLRANLAKVAVRGNIDIRFFANLDLFSDTGFQLLDTGTMQLQKNGESFSMSGLSFGHATALQDVLCKVPQEQFSILLYHYPDLVEDLDNLNVDLYLCGHTHGGQIALPYYGAIITLSKFGKKYESGSYHVNDTMLYVNRGIGGHLAGIRFFARPEITVFDITPKKNPPD